MRPEEIVEAEVREMEARAEEPKPPTDMEILRDARGAKRAHAQAQANILRLREEMADALLVEAQTREAAKQAKMKLDRSLEAVDP